MIQFKTLVADPPWPFSDKLPGAGRSAEKNYNVISIEELGRFLDEAAPLDLDLGAEVDEIRRANDCREREKAARSES